MDISPRTRCKGQIFPLDMEHLHEQISPKVFLCIQCAGKQQILSENAENELYIEEYGVMHPGKESRTLCAPCGSPYLTLPYPTLP